MILTQAEEQFIKQNQKWFEEFYARRFDELSDEVLEMPSGQERDAKMLLLKEYKAFLNSIKILGEAKMSNPKKFI